MSKRAVDPALSSYHWMKVVRPYHQVRGLPCARCGKPIDYQAKRYIPGTRKVNPISLAVGHIVGRHEARAKGWTEAQINAISNTQPEHARCSDKSGAEYGNALRNPKPFATVRTTIVDLDNSREW